MMFGVQSQPQVEDKLGDKEGSDTLDETLDVSESDRRNSPLNLKIGQHRDSSNSSNTERSSDIEGASTVDMDVYKSMLQGRLGCRPDMEAEFKALAWNHKGEDAKTIGVLACGPRAMTQAINESVHNEGSLSTFFKAGKIENEDGTDATFSFVEEDWEW